MKHDQKPYDALLQKAQTVLGSEALRQILQAQPRKGIFDQTLGRAVRSAGSPGRVTDEQIRGAAETALELWPLEAEAMRNV